jgi:hypothetical protein
LVFGKDTEARRGKLYSFYGEIYRIGIQLRLKDFLPYGQNNSADASGQSLKDLKIEKLMIS